MILEVAILQIIPNKQHSFEADFQKASQYISSIKGYIKHSLQKCIEIENQYVLLVTWETLEDHTIGFRQSKQYEAWKNLLHHYYDPFPTVLHYKNSST
jgi:heme-degrading monooxygenase HmoA